MAPEPSILAQAEHVRSGKTTALALLESCLERIERDEMELDPPSGNAGRAAIELLSLLDP